MNADMLAQQIIDQINADIADYPGLANARSFVDLHDYVDANEYITPIEDMFGEADWNTPGDPIAELINETTEIVTRLLAARHNINQETN